VGPTLEEIHQKQREAEETELDKNETAIYFFKNQISKALENKTPSLDDRSKLKKLKSEWMEIHDRIVKIPLTEWYSAHKQKLCAEEDKIGDQVREIENALKLRQKEYQDIRDDVDDKIDNLRDCREILKEKRHEAIQLRKKQREEAHQLRKEWRKVARELREAARDLRWLQEGLLEEQQEAEELREAARCREQIEAQLRLDAGLGEWVKRLRRL